jgi:cellobiose phosphorylase
MLPDDPAFLLGNYRLTLFAHSSGFFQILTGERAWGRVNEGDGVWSGSNAATVKLGGRVHNLVGLDEPMAQSANKHFGVGFARYDYLVEQEVKVSRILSVRPSVQPGEGQSAFLIQVRFENTGTEQAQLNFTESVRAN